MKTLPNRATETQCQTAIVQAAKIGGWLVHAERTSRTGAATWVTAIQGDPGFPDLVLIHPGRRELLVVELKRKPNKVEVGQRAWLDAFIACGIAAEVVWVPEELDLLLHRLMRKL